MKDLRYFDPHRRATWLELFFDLIFVVALRDAGEILSETHDGHIAPQQFLHFVLLFLPLWWIWAGHTIYANRFDTDSRQHRLSTLLIMFLLIVISAQISAGAQDRYDYALAVACYCGARLIIAVMYFVSKRKHHDRGGFATQVGTVFAVGATISLSSILLEPPWRYLVHSAILDRYAGRYISAAEAFVVTKESDFLAILLPADWDSRNYASGRKASGTISPRSSRFSSHFRPTLMAKSSGS